MSIKTNDVITIRNDALQALIDYGIDEEYSSQMVGKSFVVTVDDYDAFAIEACGYKWYIPEEAICETVIDPAVMKDFLNLL